MSFLIVLEGADCAGKDTIADYLHEMLGGARINFPCETVESGRIAREYLRGGWDVVPSQPPKDGPEDAMNRVEHLSAFALQAMMLYNRAEMLPSILRWMKRGDPVIVVRWWQSGVVYGGMDGLDMESLKRAQEFLPPADLNIYLDVDPLVSLERRAQRDGSKLPEIYEVPAKLNDARARYLELWNEQRALHGERFGSIVWPIINAGQPLEAVKDAVCRALINAAIEPKKLL